MFSLLLYLYNPSLTYKTEILFSHSPHGHGYHSIKKESMSYKGRKSQICNQQECFKWRERRNC